MGAGDIVAEDEQQVTEDEGFGVAADVGGGVDGAERGRHGEHQPGDGGDSSVAAEMPRGPVTGADDERELDDLHDAQGEHAFAEGGEAQRGAERVKAAHVGLAVEENREIALEHMAGHKGDDGLVGVKRDATTGDEQ